VYSVCSQDLDDVNWPKLDVRHHHGEFYLHHVICLFLLTMSALKIL